MLYGPPVESRPFGPPRTLLSLLQLPYSGREIDFITGLEVLYSVKLLCDISQSAECTMDNLLLNCGTELPTC